MLPFSKPVLLTLWLMVTQLENDNKLYVHVCTMT